MSEVLKTEDAPEEFVEEVEVEVYGRENRKPPRARRYVIRIDKKKYTVTERFMTGQEILALAGKEPVRHKLYQKLHGGQLKEIAHDEKVDLGAQGVERFLTVPLNETEG